MFDCCFYDYEWIFVGFVIKFCFGDMENLRKFSDRGEECCGDYGDIFWEVKGVGVVCVKFFVCVGEGFVGCIGIG